MGQVKGLLYSSPCNIFVVDSLNFTLLLKFDQIVEMPSSEKGLNSTFIIGKEPMFKVLTKAYVYHVNNFGDI